MQGNVVATERDGSACIIVGYKPEAVGGVAASVGCDAIVEEQQRAIRKAAVYVIDQGWKRSHSHRHRHCGVRRKLGGIAPPRAYREAW